MRAGNQAFQKQANLALVMDTIRQHRLVSRVEISRILGLKKSTVGNIIGDLLEIGLVEQREEGRSGSAGGRRPVYLAINASRAGVLGLEIELGYFRAAFRNLAGELLWSETREIETDEFPRMFSSILKNLEPRISREGIPLAGIGVGLPGSVDLEKGIILRSIPHKLHNYDYYSEICAESPVPVFFENDTNCGAWGELWNNPGNDINLVYLLTRFHFHNLRSIEKPGVGVGLVINGQVYYGDGYRAGEFGSNHWSEPGTEFLDMSRNELLSITSDPALMKNFLTNLLRKLSVTLSLLDPRQVMLGGDIRLYRDLVPAVLDNLRDDSWFGNQQHRIAFSSAGEHEISAGAAALVLNRLYRVPQLGQRDQKVRISWENLFDQLSDSR
jgi:DNA-binding transcriptional ArsR family regulator